MLRALLRSNSGLAIVEFALVLPVLLVMMFGVIDVTRYILIAQKTEKLAHAVANVTAQSATVTRASLDQVLNATGDIMEPFDVGPNGRVMISSLYRTPGVATARVSWQYEGGGTLARTSQLGAVGAVPTLPVTFAFEERENLIAAEVYYQFSPLLPNPWFGTTVIYRSAFYTPRFGALTTAPS